ncbi:hypothetical protein ACIRPK_34860 [Kitasatospora sp. NPDC101801]|uniref:hypothetical protein n=1 Tax=Kitasatospora sp. NPDC101801 TaxID=3364103 RepID=UPI0037FDAF9A
MRAPTHRSGGRGRGRRADRASPYGRPHAAPGGGQGSARGDRRPPHLAEAESLVEHLCALPPDLARERNRYRHAGRFDTVPDQVLWGSPGTARDFYVLSRCASLLTRVFERSYGVGTTYGWATPRFFREHVADWGPTRHAPDANSYRAAFAAGIPHFEPVPEVRELLPGDLVSIDFNRPVGALYTGHIVMIRRYRGELTHPTPGPPLPGSVVPHVFEVVDCSSRPHGDPVNFPELLATYPDTRLRDRDVSADGVGYGHIVLHEDRGAGRLVGYRRSPEAPVAFTAVEHPIAAARIRP